MPASSFPEYSQDLSSALNSLLASGQARLINLDIDQRSLLRGFIAGIMRFDDNSELRLREFVDTTLAEPRLMYAYHYQDSQQTLIFRYDNAAHAQHWAKPNTNSPRLPCAAPLRQRWSKLSRRA
ncbi:MAG: toxin-antitoxin system TumE family protein [Chloroflexia bacterium]